MRLGYFTQPVHPPAKDYRQVLRENREAILLADKLGYVEAFIGEHITDRAEPITSNYVQAHWVTTHLPKYLKRLEQAGRPVNGSGWRVAKSIFVADDEANARGYAKSPDGPYGFYFRNIMTKLVGNGRPELFRAYPDQPDDQVTLEQSLDTQVIAGTVNSVVDQILAFREVIGKFGTLLYTGHDWMDPALDRRSMELMATEVMPRVNEALGEYSPET